MLITRAMTSSATVGDYMIRTLIVSRVRYRIRLTPAKVAG